MVFGFVAFVFLVVVGVHLYLWKRLVRDTAPRGRARKAAGFLVLVLALLVPATLIGTRTGYLSWLAWPGYLWLAVMFYLLVALVVLEIPRLVISLIWRASDRRTADRDLVGAGAARAGTGTSTVSTSPTGVSRTGTDAGGAVRANTDTSGPAGAVRAETDAGSSTSGRGDTSSARTGGLPAAAEPPFVDGEPDEGNTLTAPPARRPDATGASAADGTSANGTRADGTRADGTRADGTSADGTSPRGASPSGTSPSGTSADSTAAGGKPEPAGMDRRLLLARSAAIFAGLTAAGVTGYGVKTALGPPQLDRVQIPIAKLPRALDGTRLAVVSDIHLGPLTSSRHMARIVETINSTDADIVCIVGDMVDGTVAELGAGAAPLRDIRSKQGAYFVTGNHEYYSGFEQWVEEVNRLGVRPLRNDRVEIITRGGAFDLAGVNDPGGAEFNDAPDFELALGDRDTSKPVVLMAHQPVVAHDAARYGVDLQVSGHTHGGQMVPFNYLVGVEQPVVSGYGEVDGVPVYVTNGAGFWGPPVRVGAPPQVTLIELRAP